MAIVVESPLVSVSPFVLTDSDNETTRIALLDPFRKTLAITTEPIIRTRFGVANLVNPSGLYYYDSGIGSNPLAQHETNVELRYKFLDSWLYDDFPDILRMLQVVNGSVRVVSPNEENNNNIANDTEKDLELKSDFIGMNILTLSKNKKLLSKFLEKNNLRWYDLVHNEHYVKKEQGKYVKNKLKEMQESRGSVSTNKRK